MVSNRLSWPECRDIGIVMSGHDWRGNKGMALDPEEVLREIGLQSGQTMLDVGCGEGRFSIPAASIVGEQGRILAFDASEERIEALRRSIRENSLSQIDAFVADVTKDIPVPTGTVDVCLVANVLHELVENDTVREGLREIRRVLRADGLLAIVEFKKSVGRPPGPPLSIRLSPEELESLLTQHGFELRSEGDVGPFHYLSVFEPSKS
jgi:ubiquinone/menaquinone biosynthesis C-methylase UbiE